MRLPTIHRSCERERADVSPLAHTRGYHAIALAVGLAAVVVAAEPATAKRIYIAPDDHTDYMWSLNEEGYRRALPEMLDYYLDQIDATAANPPPHQGRWNCDGSLWLWTYERNRSARDLQRLVARLRDGHVSMPLNFAVSCYGAQPTEAVLRGMYHAGALERRHQLRFPLAVAMENQTLPYGLGALWAGAGAKYSWRGICGCASRIPNAGDREHEIYWWTAADGSRILMKWNSHVPRRMGHYAEAIYTSEIVDFVDGDPRFLSRYPYPVIGAFGKGWDRPKILTDEFIRVAREKTTPTREVIVSNEQDFFAEFESRFGAKLPSLAASFGNEWDLYSASLSEVSAQVRRAVETLRSAEAMATLVSLRQPDFMRRHATARDQAWMNLGLYWEHNWTADGPIVSRAERGEWQRRLARKIAAYADTLRTDAAQTLGAMIPARGEGPRFFVFNSLGWRRTDYADLPLSAAQPPRHQTFFKWLGETPPPPPPPLLPLHVIDVSDGRETPSQIVTRDGERFVRVLARDIPPIGYKVFEIRPGQGESFPPAATAENGRVLENEFYKITVAERGAIISLLDKTRANRELVREQQHRALNDLGPGPGTLAVEDAGPVSVTLRAEASGPLAHTTRITLFRDSRRIELRNEITQNFAEVVSWGFGFNLDQPDVWHEEIGSVIRAKLLTEGGHYSPRNARYDWLTLNHYADIGGADGFGATLSNADLAFFQTGTSTVQSLDTATPMLSVLAGGQVDGAKLGIPGQGGDSHFTQRFALTTRDAFEPVAAMRFALEHQNPLQTAPVVGGSGYPENSYSLLTVARPEIFVWAVKPAEEGIAAGVIVRLWNQAHQPVAGAVEFAWAPGTAKRTTHLETDLEPARLDGNKLPVTLQPQQLQTFRIAQ